MITEQEIDGIGEDATGDAAMMMELEEELGGEVPYNNERRWGRVSPMLKDMEDIVALLKRSGIEEYIYRYWCKKYRPKAELWSYRTLGDYCLNNRVEYDPSLMGDMEVFYNALMATYMDYYSSFAIIGIKGYKVSRRIEQDPYREVYREVRDVLRVRATSLLAQKAIDSGNQNAVAGFLRLVSKGEDVMLPNFVNPEKELTEEDKEDIRKKTTVRKDKMVYKSPSRREVTIPEIVSEENDIDTKPGTIFEVSGGSVYMERGEKSELSPLGGMETVSEED